MFSLRVIQLALLGLVTADDLQQEFKTPDVPEGMTKGACPTLKPFDLDIAKLTAEPAPVFKLIALHDEEAANWSGACASLRFEKFTGARGEEAVIMQEGRRYDLNEAAPWEHPEPKKDFATIYEDDIAFFQEQQDKEKGVTNKLQAIHKIDLMQEGDSMKVSMERYQAMQKVRKIQWTIADTDYKTHLFMVRCNEQTEKYNRAGQNSHDIDQLKYMAIDKSMQAFRAPGKVLEVRTKEHSNEDFMNALQAISSFERPDAQLEIQLIQGSIDLENPENADTYHHLEDLFATVRNEENADGWLMLRKLFLMEKADLEAMAADHKAREKEYRAEVEKGQEGIYDEEYTEAKAHKLQFRLHVDDVAKYKEGGVSKLAEAAFARFEPDGGFNGANLQIYHHREDACTFNADKPTIFDQEFVTNGHGIREWLKKMKETNPNKKKDDADKDSQKEEANEAANDTQMEDGISIPAQTISGEKDDL